MSQSPKKSTEKSRRSKVKNPALKPQYNLKIRVNEIDYDYLHKLNEEELAWLNDFTEGSVNASRQSKVLNTPKDWKINEDRNNARNRCILSREEAKNNINYFSHLVNSGAIKTDNWDKIITEIDNRRKKERNKKK